MSKLNSIKEPIREEMRDFEPYFKASMKSKVPLLDIITNYIYRTKGKQMRPMFVFLSAKIHGEINESTFNAATFIELLHTATLIHDDVVDESYERRGFFSVNALWKSKIAVLVGDYLLSKGMLLAIERNEFELLKIVSSAVREMSEGELMQIEKARKLNILETDYFEIIRKKTATLIAACTASGTKSVTKDENIVEKMRQFGEYIGIAFQLKDDLFDYLPQGLIGKPTGNDIKEKKITLPLIHVIKNSSDSDRKYIFNIVRNHHKNSKKVTELIDFVNKKGGLDYTEAKMNEYKERALQILQELPPTPARQSLIDLVHYTTSRDK
jgi:octaprenyl-diphosphate synthase